MRSLASLLLLAAFPASASVCPVLEFAELEAMRAEELVALRCEYRTNMLTLSENLNTGSMRSDALNLNAASRCTTEMRRMDRILVRKLGLTGDAGENARAIFALCRDRK